MRRAAQALLPKVFTPAVNQAAPLAATQYGLIAQNLITAQQERDQRVPDYFRRCECAAAYKRTYKWYIAYDGADVCLFLQLSPARQQRQGQWSW